MASIRDEVRMKLNEVTQRRLECYERELLKGGEGEKSPAAFNRIVIEAATATGIAEGAPEGLLEMSPREVKRLTSEVLRHIAAAKEPLTGE